MTEDTGFTPEQDEVAERLSAVLAIPPEPPVMDLGYLSLPAEVQQAVEADVAERRAATGGAESHGEADPGVDPSRAFATRHGQPQPRASASEADDREPLGRIAHETYGNWLLEQVRLPMDAKHLNQWEQLSPDLREAYMRIGAAVAVRAVHDAGLRNERLEAQVFALAAHLPAVLDALRLAVAHGPIARRYRSALEALGGGEAQERSDEKEGP